MPMPNHPRGFQVLASARAIREKIRWVLANPQDTRIVLVGFVGAEPQKYLPHPKGIRLYCSLRLPGTNPLGLEKLKRNKVVLRSIDQLHTKLYWSHRRGAVMGSANLSSNALEPRRSIELAVYLPPGVIDAVKLLRRLTARRVTKAEIEKLKKQFAEYEAWRKQHLTPRRPKRRKKVARKHSKASKRQYRFLRTRGISPDRPARLRVSGRHFTFTGKCAYGTRKKCQRLTVRQGGRVGSHDGLTRDTDVLVIGANGSHSWLWKNCGRKLIRANRWRKKSKRPLIIQEERWRRAVGV